MNWLKVTTSVMALLLAGIFMVPSAQAQSTFLRRTNVTFSGPVEIPGKVLPAGSYIFQLMPGNETNLVIIRDKDEHALAILLTIPDYRLTPTGDTVITYKEQAANAPQAIRAWFYPGENYGHEFAYPRKIATQLAAANNENVPAVPDQTADNDLKTAQVTEVTPTGTDTQTQVAQASPEPLNQNQTSSATNNSSASPSSYNANSNTDTNNNLVAKNDPLPKTASPIFLIALLGIFSLGMAGLLGILGRRFRGREGQSGL